MERAWPGRGMWVVTSTAAGADARIVLAALAAAAEVPVAAVVLGAAMTAEDPARPYLAGLLELPEAARLTLDQTRAMTAALVRAHDLVLVTAPAGLLVPIGEDGWTLADLAAAAGAPAVVVTGPGPHAANHTTLALGALAGHGIRAAVVTIGAADEGALPVSPAGRIPADPADFTTAADWLDPMLRATTDPTAPSGPAPAAGRSTVSGKRLVLGLLAVFLVLVALVCGLAWSRG